MREQKPDLPGREKIVFVHLSREETERRLDALRPFKARLQSFAGGFEIAQGRMGPFEKFLKGLREKYGHGMDYCEVQHFIGGSTIKPENLKNTFFDFVGDDSIEKYLRDNYPE